MSGVVVLGSANLDLVYRVPRIPGPGETLLATSAARHPGGKGNNQVIAVARAGAPVSFIACLGEDSAGDTLLDALADAGVRALVRRVPERTGTALIVVDDGGENTIVVDAGANAELTGLTERELDGIRDADYLLMQLEVPLATVTEAARVAAAAGTRVVLNAAPVRSLPAELTENVDVLVVNEHEALGLAREIDPARRMPREMTLDNVHDVAAVLLEAVPAVVVTLGGAGSVVLSREMGENPAAHVPAPRVTPVDTTGAGDTFCGALVAALSEGGDLVSAAAFAVCAGALSVQAAGAVPSIPARSAIEQMLSAHIPAQNA